jgi:hypothetical protein
MTKYFWLILFLLHFQPAFAQMNNGNLSHFVSWDSLVIPSEVKLLEPRTNTEVAGPDVKFVWSKSIPEAKFYHFVIATGTRFTDIVYEDSTLSDTTVSVQLPASSRPYVWHVRAGNDLGWSAYSPHSVFILPTTGIENFDVNPGVLSISDIYPNPFRDAIALSVAVWKVAYVRFALYDVCGKEVASLGSRWMQPGKTELYFDSLPALSSGHYVLRSEHDGFALNTVVYHVR